MAQPTHTEIQAVDPVLTNMLVGYMQSDDRFVASRLFPVVSIPNQSGTFYKFTKKYWFSDGLKNRAPATGFARNGYGVETDTVLANLWGLEHLIADEARVNNQMPMALEQAGTQWLAQQSLIHKELSLASDFFVNSFWGTTDNNSATDWDTDPGDPINDILTARRTISTNTGYDGNTLTVGYIVHQAFMIHPDILARVQYVQTATQSTIESVLGQVFGISNYLVSKASYNTANEGQTFSASAIIDDDALVTYTAPAPSIMSASAGYTFAWEGGGGVGQIGTYREQSAKSDVLQHSESWDQKAVATDLGYLFLDIV